MAEEGASNGFHASSSTSVSPRAGPGLFQFEHTPPKDAEYQQQNLGLRGIKDAERRFALEQLRLCDNLREGEVPLFIGMVRRSRLPETKKQKPTRRVLVIGKYRILSFVRKKLGGHKVSHKFHLLELVEVNQQERDKASFTFVAANDKKQRLAGMALHGAAVPEIIYCLRIAYLRITCGFPPDYGFILRAPSALLLPLDPKYMEMDPALVGPANGFIETYLAQCNYLGVEPNNQLVQFICDLWAKNITELNLTLCPGFEPKSAVSFHLEPIIGALTHNTYFRSITIEDVARKEALHAAIMALRFNQTLTKITLAYLPDLSAENCMELRNAVINNPYIKIQMLDFQGTSISTKGAAHLATALEALPHSLHTLIISESNIGTKGMQEVIMALCKNFGMSLGLQVLDLSQNKLDEGCSKWLETWLEKAGPHSHLRKLHMARCGMMDLTFIAKPLRQLSRLVELDISHNRVDDGITQLIRVALEDTSTLENLKLEHCGLSGYNAAAILTALGTNKRLANTKLNIADNELPDTDADMLANAIKKTINLHTLNAARNKFKHAGLIQVVDALRAAVLPKIHTLVLDNTVEIARGNHGTAVAEALISLINPPDSTLRVLSIAGGFTRAVVPLLDRLSSKSPLEEFDISNNKIGDSGAVALSEMLRDNVSLKVLKCDNNGITLTGWLSFLSLFMYNHTLQWLDHPWQDYARAYASHPNTPQGERKKQKLRETLLAIQRAIESNNVSFRGWFPVAEAMDPPQLVRTDPALADVTPKYAVPADLDEFAKNVKLQEAEARKRRANGSMIVNPRASATIATRKDNKESSKDNSWEVVAAPEATKDAALEGPLVILSNVVKSWKARYFVLKSTDNVLYYWKSPTHVAKKAQGRIPLPGARVMPLAQEGITRAYCIQVHTDVRTYFLCAADKDEMDRWLGALKKAAAVDEDGLPERHPTTITSVPLPAAVGSSGSSWARAPSAGDAAGGGTAARMGAQRSTPVSGKDQKDESPGLPPVLPSRGGEEDEDEDEEDGWGKGKGKEVERELPPSPALGTFVAAPPPTPAAVAASEPFPAVHFPAPSPAARPQPAPAQLLPPSAPLYPPAAFFTPQISSPMAPSAPPPPAAPAPPPPPPVNVAKAYIPRILTRSKDVSPSAPPLSTATSVADLSSSSVDVSTPRGSDTTLLGSLSNRVSSAMSQRRSALGEDDFVSDDDDSDEEWDSDDDELL